MVKVPRTPKPDLDSPRPSKWKLPVMLGSIALILIACVTMLGIFLLRNPSLTRVLRDLVIITFALELLVMGVALIVVAVQLARLLHLLRYEIKPILEQASDTIGTLRGTAQLVSETLSAPVVKLSGTLAGALRFLKMIWPERGRGSEH